MVRTLECRPEDREAELRLNAEAGRKARIAGEFLREYLDKRRENIVRAIEDGIYHTGETAMTEALAELRVMRSFRVRRELLIQLGELAEEELRNGD